MKNVIINADDFGINKVVTFEIERQILAGNVSSTTVMANGNCLEEVSLFAILHPEISYGVHLCLSEFDSITKSSGLKRAGLVDEEGKFIHKAVFKIKDFSDETIRAISDELNAQIDIVSSLGFPISHADSHHHVHTIFALKDVFADVLNSRCIKRVRLGDDFRNWRSKRHLFLWMKQIKLNNYYKLNFTTTDAFYSYAEYLMTVFHNNEKVIELMCHPGHPGQSFINEMKFVEAKEILRIKNTKLISYNDL